MDAFAEYRRWVDNVRNEELLEDLRSIEGNEEEIRGRFTHHLSFGTAGMRGILAAGTDRMNMAGGHTALPTARLIFWK